MAALTTSRDTREKRGEVFDFDVKANTTIHQGSLVVLDAGYAAPGAAAAGLIAVGRAEESAARLTAADSALNAFLTARRNHAPDTDTKAREAAKWADRLSKYGLSAEARRIYGALAR